MSGSLYVSTAGAEARLRQLDILANNLANADTVGFRGSEVIFEATLEAALLDGERGDLRGRVFVAANSSALRPISGPVMQTGRDLDVAIQGEGFFSVETPGGVRYTRSGAFHVDSGGVLVTASGHPVLGTGGPISIGDQGVQIGADGTIRNDTGEILGRLRLEEFLEPESLQKEGQNLLRAPATAVGLPVDDVRVEPGSLEGSNVRTTLELARLVAVQRAYDASMRTLEAEDSVSQRLLQEMSR